MNVIILGAGHVGSALAQKLSDIGHRVTVIEKDPHAVSLIPRNRIDSGSIIVIHRDGSKGSSMVEAGIGDADAFIATTGKDSLNGLLAQRAKIVFGVEKVMTAVKEEGSIVLHESLGITTINKSNLASNQLVTHLSELG